MRHRDEGEIQAFLDDQLIGETRAAVAEHLLSCVRCRDVHEELNRNKLLFSSRIRDLNAGTPGPGVQPAPRPARVRRAAGSLAKAAVLVLLLAAAASALPGSPVRAWLRPSAEPVASAVVTGESTAASAPAVVPSAAVRGQVLGAGGRPLAFAHLEVLADTISGWSDEAGRFTLEGPSGARWVVRATHPGYEPAQATVTLPPAGPVTLDLTLEALPGPAPEPLTDFQPFQVTYTLPALLNLDDVAASIRRRYPVRLQDRRVEGEAVLQLWLDEQGRVARSAVSRSSGDRELDILALSVSREMRFRPAMNRDEPVRVIVLMPVEIRLPVRPGDSGGG